MRKIAFLINTISEPTGGTEKQLLLLLQGLDRESFQPTLCVLQLSTWMRESFSACPVYNLNIRSLSSPLTLLHLVRFVRYLKAQDFSILQTHFVDATMIGILAGKLAAIPSIIASWRNQGYSLRRFDRRIFSILNPSVKTFLVNSRSTRDWLTLHLGIPSHRIELIPNAILPIYTEDPTPETRRHARRRLGIPSECYLVGIVANLRPVKELDTFLRAAALLKARIPASVFLLVGSCGSANSPSVPMTEEDRLRGVAASLGIEPSIRFLGVRTDVPEILAALDVGVLTSRSESMSNSIIEYVCAGLPVVATDVGGVREIVTDGVNGYIVPVGDTLALADALFRIAAVPFAPSVLQYARKNALQTHSLTNCLSAHQRLYTRLSAHSTTTQIKGDYRSCFALRGFTSGRHDSDRRRGGD
jgi:glycosyltransferase involved in cell wall biosynthesis